MKRSVLIFVVGLLMVGTVSAGNVFFDNFEDNIEWTNWVDTSTGGNGWINWWRYDLDFGTGRGDYWAKAIHGGGHSYLELKKPLDLSEKEDCTVSFYSSGFCLGGCKLAVEFDDGVWKKIGDANLPIVPNLVYREFAIDNADLSGSSNIRFDVGNPKGRVIIDDVSIDCATSDMEVFLEFPFCGDYFMLNTTDEIRVTALDSDDYIAGNISIDGHVVEFINGGAIFNHTWNRSGNVQIELFAENTEHYMKRQIISVMVIDPKTPATYIAACMDEPSEFVDIASSNVHFDASSTRGIVNESGTIKIIDKPDLKFSWTFSDGTLNHVRDGDDPLAYSFYKNFAIPGDNWAVLDVSLKD